MNRYPDSLVRPRWLSSRIEDERLRILDARWFLPTSGRDPFAEYRQGHIPGARFFDIDAVSDTQSPLPHMLPQARDFAARMEGMGIGNDHRIIVYDAHGAFSAPRVWWMLRVFGHRQCAILDGGLPEWKRLGLPLEATMPPPAQPARFTARKDAALIADYADVRRAVDDAGIRIVDGRSPGRFSGREKEPRKGLASGHIPTSVNLHYDRLVDASGTFLSPQALQRLVQDHGLDSDREVIATCGSGITACSIAFALHLLGHDRVRVYDGSWSEWGSRSPIGTTP